MFTSALKPALQCVTEHSALHALRPGCLRLANVRLPQQDLRLLGRLSAVLLPALLLLPRAGPQHGGQLLLLQHGGCQAGQTISHFIVLPFS